MSNSSLVSYTKISPSKTSPRRQKIKGIAIHCMAGNLSLKTCGEIFQNNEASSNYGVDSNGNIGMYVEEKDRAWTTSTSYDHYGVTIEVANDGGENTGWHSTDKAVNATIKLCADICKRNGIKKMHYFGNKADTNKFFDNDKSSDGAFYVHRWYDAKSCPGDYLYGMMPYICAEVNKLLGAESDPVPKPSSIEKDSFEDIIMQLQSAINKEYKKNLDVDGIVGKETFSATPSLSKTTRAKKPLTVTAFQKLLVYYGISIDVDGDFYTGTEAGVKKFQQQNKCEVTGTATAKGDTWAKLLNYEAKPIIPNTNIDNFESIVKELQTALNKEYNKHLDVDGIPGELTLAATPTINSGTTNTRPMTVSALQKLLNYYGAKLDVDGYYGNRSINAVVDFQRTHGCVVDGVVTAKNLTWKKLLKLA